jgi:hypothetical protein
VSLIGAAVITAACGSQSTPGPQGSLQATVVEVAVAASRGEGILHGEPRSVRAAPMTLDEAEGVLTAWGADFPEFIADYPPPDTPVWVVEILGRGVQPGPPDIDRQEECLDIRVIVLPEEGHELALFGKPSDGC